MDRTNLFTAYIGRNADRERTYVEVDMTGQQNAATSLTTFHEPVPAGNINLAITGWTLRYRGRSWSGGGQIRDDLLHMTEIADGWKLSDVRSLFRIWRDYHLNDMTPACAHMNVDGLAEGYDARKHLVCPETGYRYGSAHLTRIIPADVWAELRRLSELPSGKIDKGIG